VSENNGSLPYSEDGERGVICSLLLNPRLAGEIRREVGTDYFYSPANKFIYQSILDLLDSGEVKPDTQVDFVILKSYLADAKHQGCGTWLDEIGGPETLNEIFNFIPTAAGWKYYADIVREKWARREKILDCRRREKAAFDLESLETDWDPDGSFLGATAARKLTGASFLDLSRRPINHADTLLGDRYLCRGGGLFIVGPSGQGKSVLESQASILWACGKPAFGIRPARPLRSLIIQAEDDEGDTIEMAQIVDHLKLTDREKKLIGENTHVEFVNDVTGDAFIKLCDDFLAQKPSDLLWINPYTAYLGADIKDDEKNSRFLRNGLNPVLTKNRCATVPIHHTPKLNFRGDTTEWKPSEWMYAGAGAAVLTNWARAYLVIDPCKEAGVYKFIAAKRGKRIGWGDHIPVFESFWAHTTEEGKLLWVPATALQEAQAKSSRNGSVDKEALLNSIPVLDPKLKAAVEREFNEKTGIGINRIHAALNELAVEEAIFSRKIPNPDKGPPFTGWARTPEPE
jgi:DnaB-like helicase N terminal domain/AAA domain